MPHLATLSTAVWEGRTVAVDYDRGNGVVSRTLGPLGLVLKGGIWYVPAVVDGQAYRMGIASRARDASDEAVDRPEDFDLAAFWVESSSAYEREAPTVVVDVRIPEDQAWRLNQVFGRGTVAAGERVEETTGMVRLRLRLGYPDEAPGLLLAVGHELDVLGPPEVLDKVVILANRIADRYREVAPVEALAECPVAPPRRVDPPRLGRLSGVRQSSEPQLGLDLALLVRLDDASQLDVHHAV